MSINEQARHHLYQRLEEMLDPDAPATLMTLLPPAGWADVATKRDLDGLEQRTALRFGVVDQRFVAVDQRFDAIDRRLDALDGKLDRVEVALGGFHRDLRNLVLAMMGTVVAVGGLIVAALKF